MHVGKLNQRFSFDSPAKAPDGAGGVEIGWHPEFTRWGELIYRRGSEAVDAARLEGRTVYKLRLRSDSGTRQIKSGWRVRDVNRQETNDLGDYIAGVYDIRDVDDASDRAWIFLLIESAI